MTLTEARRWAAQARRGGYFDQGPAGLEIDCPRGCGTVLRFRREYGRSPPSFRQETLREAIDRAVTGHLMADGECEPKESRR